MIAGEQDFKALYETELDWGLAGEVDSTKVHKNSIIFHHASVETGDDLEVFILTMHEAQSHWGNNNHKPSFSVIGMLSSLV